MSMLDYPPASRILPSVDRARLFVPIRRKPSLLGLSLIRASMRDGRSSWLTGSETRSWFLHRGEDSLGLGISFGTQRIRFEFGCRVAMNSEGTFGLQNASLTSK
ncbi:unnamed protein product [Musa acuminata var. zebrina]